ncbi:MAG TPA: hypothetical protein PLW75_01320 [Hyphomicrobium sp.]|nr:hypothetical protein [Hyphomicrobium sp.]
MSQDLVRFRDRYSGPWTVEETDAGFVVRAACGARLAWVYFRDLPSEWRIGQFYALDKAEARAMAGAIAGLAKKTPER